MFPHCVYSLPNKNHYVYPLLDPNFPKTLILGSPQQRLGILAALWSTPEKHVIHRCKIHRRKQYLAFYCFYKAISDVEEHILSQSQVITARKTNKHKNPKQKLNKSNVRDSNPSLRELTKMAVHTKTYRPKLFPNIPVVTLI